MALFSHFSPSAPEGVHFKTKDGHWPFRDIIFLKLSNEFGKKLEKVNDIMDYLFPSSKCEEEKEKVNGRNWPKCATPRDRMLYALSLWYMCEDDPTGKDLYVALRNAGCPKGLLKRNERFLKVNPQVCV